MEFLGEYPKSYIDENIGSREGYTKGYNQAMQDFMEKAEMYLKTRVYYNMHSNNVTKTIQEFKNYMQNEIQD